MTPRDVQEHKRKAPRSLRPPRRRPSSTQQRRERGGLIHQKWHQGKKVALKEAQEHKKEH